MNSIMFLTRHLISINRKKRAKQRNSHPRIKRIRPKIKPKMPKIIKTTRKIRLKSFWNSMSPLVPQKK
jgi:hypothetical protein